MKRAGFGFLINKIPSKVFKGRGLSKTLKRTFCSVSSWWKVYS